jgi:histidinol-phosphate aminotransferase/threonine-phosphate decarboxylase
MDPDAVDDLCSRVASDGAASGEDACEGPRVPHGSADDPWLLDFSANTNSRTPDGTARVFESALAAARTYPAEDYCEFRCAAANYLDCEALQIIPTAGGMAAIRLAVATTLAAGDRALLPTPSFGEYAREVRLQGGDPEFVAVPELPRTDPSPYALAVVCQPNNPTGTAYDEGTLREFATRCRDAGTVLLADEAFLDFTERDSLAGHPGVVVARSLTKIFGLPGLRMGYAVATGDLRDRLDGARPTWGMSAPAAAVGTHCLGDRAFVEATRERLAAERERLRDRLSARFDVRPSEAPFLLLDAGDPESVDAAIQDARTAGIAVRDARTFRGLDSHLRVAVRRECENDLLLDAFDV